MAHARSVVLAITSVALLAVGLDLLRMGITASARARAAFEQEIFRSVSRTREVDAIALGARGAPAEREQARVSLEHVIASASLPTEPQALSRMRDCLVATCPGQFTDAVEEARRVYADALARADAAKRADLDGARGLQAVGFVVSGLCLLPVLFLLVGRLRRQRSPDPPLGPAPGGQTATPLEREFRLRLGALYAVRSRAQESESFAAYGEIGAGLAHGLKTPLAGVRAAAQLAMQSLDPDHPAAGALEDIVDSVDQLTEEIATFLRSIGTGQPHFEVTEPQDLVEGLIARYRAEAERRGLQFSLVADETPAILVDRGLLEMAMRNLFENALQFAPPGTTIDVVVGTVDAPARAGLERTVLSSSQRATTWIQIGVVDRGAGVPAEVLAGQRPATQRPGGSGLGLSLARRIAGRHGGALELSSPVEGGTLARIVLPAAEPG